MSNKDRASEIRNLWEASNSEARLKFLENGQTNVDFFLNNQLTADENNQLLSAGMPNFIINKITPAVEMMKYFVTAKSPRWQAIGVEGSDTDLAHVHSSVAEYDWYNSNGQTLFGYCVQDCLNRGIGYMQVDIDPNRDNGMGEVVFKQPKTQDIFVDLQSKDFLFRDASYIGVHKVMSRTQLLSFYPQYANKIKKASGQPSIEYYSERMSSADIQDIDIIEAYDTVGKEDDILELFEVYFKEQVGYRNIYYRIPPTPEQMEMIQKQADEQLKDFIAEMQVQLKENLLKLEQAFRAGEIIEERFQLEAKRLQEQTAEAIKVQQTKVKQELEKQFTKIGNKIVTDKEYKILLKNRTFLSTLIDAILFFKPRIKMTIVISDTFIDEYLFDEKITEYPLVPLPYIYTGCPFPMAYTSMMIGKQREINRGHQIVLHNANLGSSLRYMYEEGAIDEGEWEEYSSSPGALLKYRKGFNKPEILAPMPVNNAFITLVQESKQDMEDIHGMYSHMAGNAATQSDTYRGMLAQDEFGTRRVKQWVTNVVEPMLEHLGKVHCQFAQAVYTAHKVFRLVQPSALQDNLNVKESEINIPIWDDKTNSVIKAMDYSNASLDVRFVAGSTLPINRWAYLDELFKWFQAGIVDDIAFLKETDIKDKDGIVNRNSMYAKLKSQLKQLDEMLSDKIGENETLKRQLVQAGIKSEIDKAGVQIDKETNESKSQQKHYRNEIQSELDRAKKDLASEVSVITRDYKNQMKNQLEKVKINNNKKESKK